MRRDERVRMVRRMRTECSGGLSDHKAKIMEVKVKRRKWRRNVRMEVRTLG